MSEDRHDHRPKYGCLRATAFAFIALTFAAPLSQVRSRRAAVHCIGEQAAPIEFEAGCRLSKLPNFLVNLCQVADEQNRVQDAINYREPYLCAEPSAKESAEKGTRLDEMRRRQADPTALTIPGQTVAVIAKAAERPPIPKTALALQNGGAELFWTGVCTGLRHGRRSSNWKAGPCIRIEMG